MRQLTVLHPASARRYLAMVATVAPGIESALSPSVLANRVAGSSTDPPTLRLAPWRAERVAFGAGLRRLGGKSPCLVFADVRDCYGSITPEAVVASLIRLRCDRVAAEAVGAFLGGLVENGARGLPVGPDASAVLANAVLALVDHALERARIRHLRWVDDVVASTGGPEEADRILELVRASLTRVGLELNESKTRVVVDPAAIASAQTVSMARSQAPVG